jgi:hypothetical protein
LWLPPGASGGGVLLDQPGRAHVTGAACQPWQADVIFSAIPTEQFLSYAEPDRVKIVWSIEVDLLEPTMTRVCPETRGVATNEQARAKFKRYWRLLGIGIRMIRWFLLPALRRQAKQMWRMIHLTSTAKSTHPP